MKTKRIFSLIFVSLLFISIIAIVSTSSLPNADIEETGIELTPKAPIVFTGTVSQGSDSTVHTFTVPTTATLIEVSLSFSSSYDYDLSLWDNLGRRTGGWTSSDHSQKESIPNSDYSGYSANPEWIDVDPPATFGTWSVGCYSYRGSGSYTITVTITTATADTTPPIVSLTAPASGATLSGSVTVSASASDNIGVDHVTFQVDGSTLATDSSSPYQTILDTTTLTDGSHTITAIAYDAAGNYDQDSVTITVENGGTPDNELTSGETVYGSLSAVGQTEMWYMNVGSNAVSMRSVLNCGSADFDLYGRLGTEPTTSTYDWRGYTSGGEDVTFSNPGAGIWYIMVRDYSGSGSYDLTVTITYSTPDTTKPTVDITSPSSGATVSGTITISATASDNVGVDHVTFQVDGSTLSTDSSSPYQASLDTTALSNSVHTITATAYDAAGNYAQDSVSITVDNSVPDNELTSGVTVTGSLSSVGQTEMWYINVGADGESMHSVLNCGSADFDLYGRLGAEPTTSTYDWRGYTSGGEDVTFSNPGQGIWYIMVRDYSGSGSYDLTVTITYSGPDTTPPTITITNPTEGATVSTAKIDWSGSDADSGIDYYEVRIDSGTWVNKGTSTTHTFTAADGSHSVDVRAWDVAGNSNTDSVSFIVDSSVQNDVVKYAVIVGISDYEAISDLSYCDEDATDWYNHLHGSQMDYDYLWVYGDGHTSNYPIYTGLATEYNVKQALTNMVNLADDNDIIAFISSGHGAGTGTGSSYLCMWDCSSGENGQDGNLYDTELAAILDDAVAEKIFVFLDHCYSGGFGPELMNMPNSDNVYCATTCTQNGYGYDDPSHLNGAWTYYFLQYAWINHFGGSSSTSMEAIFDYTLAAYPYDGGDTPQEFDGNTAQSFYLV